MTRAAGADLFGSAIPYSCTSGGVSTSGTFMLQNDLVDSCTSINVDNNSVMNNSTQVLDYDWLIYSTTALSSQDYADFEITLPVTFSDSARGAFLMSFTGLLNFATTNQNSINNYPNNTLNTSITAISQNTLASQNAADYYGYIRLDYSYNNVSDYYYYRPILYDITNGVSGLTIRFEHVRSTSSGEFSFAIACPYIYGSASSGAVTTTVTTSGSSSGTDVNVNVDMSETNGLLGQIKSILQGIVDGIKNLFIPSDEALQDFSDDMDDLLQDHLGGLYEAEDILVSYWDQFQNVSAMESIYIPACHVPLAGVDFVLGNWTVPLKPAGMPAILYNSIAWIIDFLAVSSFLNMCRKKLEIFLNPDSEVVSNDN